MVSINPLLVLQEAKRIPYITANEAYALLKVQHERLLALLETLGREDWAKPTACTAWNVREMVAHQAGSYASGTGYPEMMRQYSGSILPKPGRLPEDMVNERQVRERAKRTPEELIAEIRVTGPTAIHKWAFGFRLAKLIQIPHPIAGMFSLRHLMWVIHSRDTWMHRLDICRATGRTFEQKAEEDSRITALVMLDVQKALKSVLGGKSVVFQLPGAAGGNWRVGNGEPWSTIQMDALDFHILASGRFDYAEGLSRASLTGDIELAQNVLKNLIVVY